MSLEVVLGITIGSRSWPKTGHDPFLFFGHDLNVFLLCFSSFLAKNHSKKFGSNKFRLNSTRAFDWCINFHIWLRKNFHFFLVRVRVKNVCWTKIYLQPDMTIYTHSSTISSKWAIKSQFWKSIDCSIRF